eukprot:TRINITY_DN118_c1_g2_i1.p1 TRINITY_DN118_c1_g2~~TRINITY_DN118_c1_g2_i1.p1  ORF type:complete len:1598 (+),score=551.06 TRINITY_DN118_c1_g2_i1:12085-16878(+)
MAASVCCQLVAACSGPAAVLRPQCWFRAWRTGFSTRQQERMPATRLKGRAIQADRPFQQCSRQSGCCHRQSENDQSPSWRSGGHDRQRVNNGGACGSRFSNSARAPLPSSTVAGKGIDHQFIMTASSSSAGQHQPGRRGMARCCSHSASSTDRNRPQPAVSVWQAYWNSSCALVQVCQYQKVASTQAATSRAMAGSARHQRLRTHSATSDSSTQDCSSTASDQVWPKGMMACPTWVKKQLFRNTAARPVSFHSMGPALHQRPSRVSRISMYRAGKMREMRRRQNSGKGVSLMNSRRPINSPESTKNRFTPKRARLSPGMGKKCPTSRKRMARPRQPSRQSTCSTPLAPADLEWSAIATTQRLLRQAMGGLPHRRMQHGRLHVHGLHSQIMEAAQREVRALVGHEAAEAGKAFHHDGVGPIARGIEQLEVVREHHEGLASLFQGLPHQAFQLVVGAGAQLYMARLAGAVIEDRHRILEHAITLHHIQQRRLRADPAVQAEHGAVVAAVVADAVGGQCGERGAVEAETARPEGVDDATASLFQQALAGPDEGGLLFQRELAQVGAARLGLRDQGGMRFGHPFGVQVLLYFLSMLADETDDLLQRTHAEARRKERLHKEHTMQAMFLELLQLVAQRRVAIHVVVEGGRETRVDIVPAIAPDFDIDSEEDVKHEGSTDVVDLVVKLLQHQAIHEELGGPVGVAVSHVFTIDRVRALERAAHVEVPRAQVLDTHVEAIGAPGMVDQAAVPRDARQAQPVDGHLRIAGHAGPVYASLPTGSIKRRQGAVVALVPGDLACHQQSMGDMVFALAGQAHFQQATDGIGDGVGERRIVGALQQAIVGQPAIVGLARERPIRVGDGRLQVAVVAQGLGGAHQAKGGAGVVAVELGGGEGRGKTAPGAILVLRRQQPVRGAYQGPAEIFLAGVEVGTGPAEQRLSGIEDGRGDDLGIHGAGAHAAVFQLDLAFPARHPGGRLGIRRSLVVARIVVQGGDHIAGGFRIGGIPLAPADVEAMRHAIVGRAALGLQQPVGGRLEVDVDGLHRLSAQAQFVFEELSEMLHGSGFQMELGQDPAQTLADLAAVGGADGGAAGQAQQARRQVLCMPGGGLVGKRDAVAQPALYALLAQLLPAGGQVAACRKEQHHPGQVAPRCKLREADGLLLLQRRVVMLGHATSRRDDAFQARPLGQRNAGIKIADPGLDRAGIGRSQSQGIEQALQVVAAGTGALGPQIVPAELQQRRQPAGRRRQRGAGRTQFLIEGGVIDQQHAPRATDAGHDGLGLRKTEQADIAEGPQQAALVAHAGDLGRIVDQEYPGGAALGFDRVDGQWAGKHVRRHQGQRCLFQGLAQRGHVQVEVVADGDRLRLQTAGADRADHAGADVGRHQHDVALRAPPLEGRQGQCQGGVGIVQCIGARRRVVGVQALRQLCTRPPLAHAPTQQAARHAAVFSAGPVGIGECVASHQVLRPRRARSSATTRWHIRSVQGRGSFQRRQASITLSPAERASGLPPFSCKDHLSACGSRQIRAGRARSGKGSGARPASQRQAARGMLMPLRVATSSWQSVRPAVGSTMQKRPSRRSRLYSMLPMPTKPVRRKKSWVSALSSS